VDQGQRGGTGGGWDGDGENVPCFHVAQYDGRMLPDCYRRVIFSTRISHRWRRALYWEMGVWRWEAKAPLEGRRPRRPPRTLTASLAPFDLCLAVGGR
jgi:hypothetical protein